ncbi:MAG TPA: threonylcarbamoyl-AMP synthase, partial [Pseudoalteromonas shioyasakiensis]|nr:threonylcarbamoyl-AMP synthase [Pseudoalteromonas shioyasakiensis]
DRIEKQVDLIIHGGYLPEQATTVIDLSDDDIEILRVGCGDTKPFE